jgi:hypothetical protein
MTSNQLLSNLLERAGIPATLTTAEAAAALNRKPQTLRKWAFTGRAPVQPVRINGRLAWPADKIAAILAGGDAQ